MATGYSFSGVNGAVETFTSPATSRQGARSDSECIAKFAQIETGNWYMSHAPSSSEWTQVTQNSLSFDDCANSECSGDCQMITYSYKDSVCWKRMKTPPNGNAK